MGDLIFESIDAGQVQVKVSWFGNYIFKVKGEKKSGQFLKLTKIDVNILIEAICSEEKEEILEELGIGFLTANILSVFAKRQRMVKIDKNVLLGILTKIR